MAVQTRCPQCNKRYVAPDHMGGRRVRCRDCGTVFALPTEPDPHYVHQAGSGGSSVAMDALSASSSGQHAALSANGTKGGVAVAHPHTAAALEANPQLAAASSDLDALDAARSDPNAPGWTPPPRANIGFDFPLSRYVDRWLPLVLLLIGAAWLLSRTVASNPAGPAWVTMVRVMVFFAAFAGLVYPAGRVAMYRSARKLHFALPPNPGWRVFGVLAVPFAAAVAMWLVMDGAATGLVLGCFAGSIVLAGGLWLLFRLKPEELPLTLGAGVGAYVGAVIVSAILVLIVNQIMVAVTRGSDTPTTLAMSPLGPGLAWPAPADPWAGKDKSKPGTLVKAGVGATEARVTPQIDPNPAAERTPADTGTGSNPDATRADGGADSQQATVPTQRVPQDGSASQQQPGANQGLVVVAPPSGETTAATTSGASLVTSVTQPLPGPVQDVLYAPGNPDLLATVRALGAASPQSGGGAATGGVLDEIQVWDTRTWRPVLRQPQVIGRPAGPLPTYRLSPDGKRVAYVSEFPSLTVKVVSFETGGGMDLLLNRNVNIAERGGGTTALNLGQPYLAGFIAPTELVVHWKNPSASWIETRPVTGAGVQRFLKQFESADFQPEAGHFTLNPRDRTLALVTHRGPTAEVYLYNLGSKNPTREAVHSIILGLDWTTGVAPTGLQFSPDGSKLAALFVMPGDDKARFVQWEVAPGRAPQFVQATDYFSPLRSRGSRGLFFGPALRWLGRGDAWLAYGSAVFDARGPRARHLGDLGVPNVIAQGSDGADVCHLMQMSENAGANPADAGLTLSAVKVNLAAAAPSPAGGGTGTPQPGGTATPPPTPPGTKLFDVPGSP